jgi:hypothetical protein
MKVDFGVKGTTLRGLILPEGDESGKVAGVDVI